MAIFSNSEYVEMVVLYGDRLRNANTAAADCWKRYSNRQNYSSAGTFFEFYNVSATPDL